MAERLINELSVKWDPRQYHDTYREDLMRRIEEKVRKGQTHSLPRGSRDDEREIPAEGAKVIDLMSVLKRSLRQTGRESGPGSGRATPARSRAIPARRNQPVSRRRAGRRGTN